MNPLKAILNFFRKLWHAGEPPPEPTRIVNTATIFDTNYDFYIHLQDIEKDNRNAKIRTQNTTRKTKFSNAEHFKQRQPTTARKLWNPQAKLEEEENQ